VAVALLALVAMVAVHQDLQAVMVVQVLPLQF
jgi:hypothetical protein